MSWVCIFTMLGTKLSFIILVRIDLQSCAVSPNSRHMASRAIFTAGGGLLIDRISTRSFFFIPLTASIRRQKERNATTMYYQYWNIIPAHGFLQDFENNFWILFSVKIMQYYTSTISREPGIPVSFAYSGIHVVGNVAFIKSTKTYEMSSVVKWTIVEIKFSLIMILRSDFHSKSVSPSSVHIDSMANFTTGGGLGKDLTSTKCCFLMDLTASLNSRHKLKITTKTM